MTIIYRAHQNLPSPHANPILYSISFPCEIRSLVLPRRHRLSHPLDLASMRSTWDGTETRKLACNIVFPHRVQSSREDGVREKMPVPTGRHVSHTKIPLGRCCLFPRLEVQNQISKETGDLGTKPVSRSFYYSPSAKVVKTLKVQTRPLRCQQCNLLRQSMYSKVRGGARALPSSPSRLLQLAIGPACQRIRHAQVREFRPAGSL